MGQARPLRFWNTTSKYSTETPEALCPWPFERAYISPDQRVVPCCVIGNPDVADNRHQAGKAQPSLRSGFPGLPAGPSRRQHPRRLLPQLLSGSRGLTGVGSRAPARPRLRSVPPDDRLPRARQCADHRAGRVRPGTVEKAGCSRREGHRALTSCPATRGKNVLYGERLVVDTVFGNAPFDSANAAVRAVILPNKDPKGGPTNTMSIGSVRAKPNEVRIAARSRSRTAINRLKFPPSGRFGVKGFRALKVQRLAGVVDISSYFRRRSAPSRQPALNQAQAIDLASMGGEINGTYLDIARGPAPERKVRSKQPPPPSPPRARRPPEGVPRRAPPPESAPPGALPVGDARPAMWRRRSAWRCTSMPPTLP